MIKRKIINQKGGKMKVIIVLFLILLPILLSAEYEPKVIVKHPFEVERDSIDPIADTLIILKDSLSRGTFLKMTIYDGLGRFAVDSGYAIDSGTAHLSYDNWNDNSPIDTADIDSVKIELPNAYRYDETLGGGEPENPVEYYFGTSLPLRGTPMELTDKEILKIKLQTFDVQNIDISIGEGYEYSFNFIIMADPHIGHGGNDFEGEFSYDDWSDGYTAEWQGTNGDLYEPGNITKHVKINRAVTKFIRDYNDIFRFKFLFVLGDISESAERAELECARDLLDNCAKHPVTGNIDIPYIPIFGNHDTWSYYRNLAGTLPEQDHGNVPCGWSFKNWGFGEHYNTLQTLPPFGNWKECYYLNNIVENVEGSADSYFFNFSFDYQNYHFICTDFNTRKGAYLGGGTLPGTTIYTSHTGNTWNWFWEDFENAREEGREIVILDHHPLDFGISDFGDYVYDFKDKLDDLGVEYFDYWFGGHKHQDKTETITIPPGNIPEDIVVKRKFSVGNSYDGWCKTVSVRDPYFLDLFCTLNPSGENYVFEGKINHSPGSSDEYYFHLLNEDEMIEGSGAINKTYEYTSTGTKTVTLDAVIEGSHYTITKAFEIPYANYLVLQNETISTTETYEATNYIDAGTDFQITSDGDVITEAGNKIYLEPGFQAQNGCKFKASIDESLKDAYVSSPSATDNLSLSIPKTKIPEEKLKANTSVKETKELIPTVFSCAQNYPNPFGDNTTIKYGLPMNSHVKLTIFNLTGQAVRTLADENQTAGFKQVRWDGKNSMGAQVPQGIYFYVFKADDFEEHRKMVMVK